MSTETSDYAERLRKKQTVWWKRLLRVQAPYQWNLRRTDLGTTLDVGCGIGRNLATLPAGSLGVDHNVESVRLAKEMGHPVLTTQEFLASDRARPGQFRSLLLAHVIEHLDRDDAVDILRTYLPYASPGGKVFIVCPQERGYASDPTHIRFCDESELESIARDVGLEPVRSWSFPFPRRFGKLFIYNEFCVVSRIPA
ncbi:MAG TPA: methyltransferase domain-containing protein [Lapillicoccus sp.]|nr:methyltransferase domain-containing protein [Lapillicoccus sp.]